MFSDSERAEKTHFVDKTVSSAQQEQEELGECLVVFVPAGLLKTWTRHRLVMWWVARLFALHEGSVLFEDRS